MGYALDADCSAGDKTMSDLQAVCLTVAVFLGMFLCFLVWLVYTHINDLEAEE